MTPFSLKGRRAGMTVLTRPLPVTAMEAAPPAPFASISCVHPHPTLSLEGEGFGG